MRFIGYKVGEKRFGCNETARKKAEAESKKTGMPVELYRYKI